MRTSVAQEFPWRALILAQHRAYTKCHAFWSTFRQSIHSRMTKHRAPCVSSGSRSSLASGISASHSLIYLSQPEGDLEKHHGLLSHGLCSIVPGHPCALKSPKAMQIAAHQIYRMCLCMFHCGTSSWREKRELEMVTLGT